MKVKVKVNSGGIGILGLLGIVFITLKLVGVINWSWWWIILPFWIGPIIVIILAIIYVALNTFSK